ncbi:molybdenum transport protein [Desulfotomaculum arcticum]|uniref:Putative pyrophosphorylase ModD n=1 Tax=Desulfotruncus arcticus DSM 17038 TaxID=1121424 RepID=A0A1I2XEI0_9FIRM|nr:ModD protein [Desulfotruncus arcticus]SFH10451.1 molybdenum transport protein [Desulfotomaculum arcticum] [Desulfotruncus arcticus DSM 17038]
MIYIPDSRIDYFIGEDVPYIDLTTLVLGIGSEQGKIRFVSREDSVISGTEEVLKICQKLNIDVINYLPSGTVVKPGEEFIEAVGKAGDLHKAWKISLNIVEYCSGIATRTKRLVDMAQSVKPKVTIVATRKNFPGTKDLAIKAVVAGGGFPHRLGLSETILVFKQHLNFLGGMANLIKMIDTVKTRASEKKVIVEVDNLEEAIMLCNSGVDGIQFDKVPPAELINYVTAVKEINPGIIALGAGGINEKNIAAYAGTGIDVVVTTSVYFGKPADIGVTIDKV